MEVRLRIDQQRDKNEGAELREGGEDKWYSLEFKYRHLRSEKDEFSKKFIGVKIIKMSSR